MNKILLLLMLALASCAPAVINRAAERALRRHADTVAIAMIAAAVEFDPIPFEQLVSEISGDCLKNEAIRIYSWEPAPQGTKSCTVEVIKTQPYDSFKVTVVGDESTGNFKYSTIIN
jgi:hypothetical protein